MATVEFCIGGLVGSLLTAVPGASAVYLGGVVSYANAAKEALLGVSSADLESEGAVSRVVVEAMAEGVRARLGSTYALAITGIAGPDGGTAEKPVGTVWLGLATPDGVISRQVFLPGDRERIRTYSAYSALEMLRRHLESVSS